jgi:hypothetical protein
MYQMVRMSRLALAMDGLEKDSVPQNVNLASEEVPMVHLIPRLEAVYEKTGPKRENHLNHEESPKLV